MTKQQLRQQFTKALRDLRTELGLPFTDQELDSIITRALAK